MASQIILAVLALPVVVLLLPQAQFCAHCTMAQTLRQDDIVYSILVLQGRFTVAGESMLKTCREERETDILSYLTLIYCRVCGPVVLGHRLHSPSCGDY